MYTSTFIFLYRPDAVLEDVGDHNSLVPCGAEVSAPGLTAAGSGAAVKRSAVAASESSGKSSRRSSSLVSPLAALGAVKRQVRRD